VTSFVIDASVALTYLLEQAEGAKYAEAAMEALHRFGALAPSIWPSELANAAVVPDVNYIAPSTTITLTHRGVTWAAWTPGS